MNFYLQIHITIPTTALFPIVTVRTRIVQPPVDTSVLLGRTTELQCKVSNDPSVMYDMAWFHNSQYV
jgi:protein sidekick